MNLNHPELIEKHGNWMKVQVAFYDFLFNEATLADSKAFNIDLLEILHNGSFAEGEEFYENIVQSITKLYDGPNAAWKAFLLQEGIKE